MKIDEKLRILIPHWIEHNGEHSKEFRQWADEDTLAAEDLIAAAAAIDQANQYLAAGLEKLGGELDYPKGHGHFHGGENEHKNEHKHEHGVED